MTGMGLGGAGGDSPERQGSARITRVQLRIQIARWREILRQRYRRLTKKQPWQ